MWSCRMPLWTSAASWSSRSSSPLVWWCWTPCAVRKIRTAPGRWCRILADRRRGWTGMEGSKKLEKSQKTGESKDLGTAWPFLWFLGGLTGNRDLGRFKLVMFVAIWSKSKESGHSVLWLRWSGMGIGMWILWWLYTCHIMLYSYTLLFWESVGIYVGMREMGRDPPWRADDQHFHQRLVNKSNLCGNGDEVHLTEWSNLKCYQLQSVPAAVGWWHVTFTFLHFGLDQTYDSNLFLAHLCSKHVVLWFSRNLGYLDPMSQPEKTKWKAALEIKTAEQYMWHPSAM